ncbi:hypothetical protein L596_013828 [Steinernema carpocapsae]|uniref:TIL domain-containing protein n=1 Tax=Steinernema carpocapsae TaxID=34508 RepID=A0A4U5P1B8_STECR|nr:hypothetical protein L596_013828 [Steinernema carpocapsae]
MNTWLLFLTIVALTTIQLGLADEAPACKTDKDCKDKKISQPACNPKCIKNLQCTVGNAACVKNVCKAEAKCTPKKP